MNPQIKTMNMAPLTALEIFSQPDDLAFTTGQDKDDTGLFAFGVFRGPKHNYKTLLTTRPFAKTKEELLEFIKKELEELCEFCKRKLKDPNDIISRILNPEQKELDESKILNQDLIDRIIAELDRNGSASTWEVLAQST